MQPGLMPMGMGMQPMMAPTYMASHNFQQVPVSFAQQTAVPGTSRHHDDHQNQSDDESDVDSDSKTSDVASTSCDNSDNTFTNDRKRSPDSTAEKEYSKKRGRYS